MSVALAWFVSIISLIISIILLVILVKFLLAGIKYFQLSNRKLEMELGLISKTENDEWIKEQLKKQELAKQK